MSTRSGKQYGAKTGKCWDCGCEAYLNFHDLCSKCYTYTPMSPAYDPMSPSYAPGVVTISMEEEDMFALLPPAAPFKDLGEPDTQRFCANCSVLCGSHHPSMGSFYCEECYPEEVIDLTMEE